MCHFICNFSWIITATLLPVHFIAHFQVVFPVIALWMHPFIWRCVFNPLADKKLKQNSVSWTTAVWEKASDSRDALINSVKVTCLSRSPTVALILTVCSAQVSMHHAVWRIKIELTAFGERTSSQISHLQQLLADPAMKHHRQTWEETSRRRWIISTLKCALWKMNGEKVLKGAMRGLFFYFSPAAKTTWD